MEKREHIFLIVAKSGAGKDYICDKICDSFNLSRVISRTTRKSRGANDKHIFVSEEQADIEYNRAVAKTLFNQHRYYVLEEDIVGKDLYIVDTKGVESLKKTDIIDCTTIYIDTSWYIRMKHMRRRGDSWINVIGRLLHDRKAFKGLEADIIVKRSDDVFNLFRLLHYVEDRRKNV